MGDFLNDPSGRLDFRDMPCARISVNYPMTVVPEAKGAHTPFNGATWAPLPRSARAGCHLLHDRPPLCAGRRQIPGTQNSREPIPTEDQEPRWMKLSTTAPAPAGCAMIRDLRAW